MTISEKRQVCSYILDYLKNKIPKFVIKNKLFTCPKCKKVSANIFPINSNKVFCYSKECQNLGDIFQIARMIDFDCNSDIPDEDIAKYLKKEFKIQTNNDVDKLLQKYIGRNWQCFPLQPNKKEPVEGISWKKNSTCNLQKFQEWINGNLGLGLHLGEKSNCIALDIDDQQTQEKVKHLVGETLTQTTRRGNHYCYNYDKDFDKINHVNLRNKGYEMEVRANNSYIAIAPTFVDNVSRSWNDKEQIDMPKELKEFLLSLIDKEVEKKDDDKIQKAINSEELGDINLSGLDGCRNDSFIKIAGILRKKLNYKNTEYSLNVFNKLLKKQVPSKEIKAMLREVKKYDSFDKVEMSKELLIHLEKLEQANSRDLKDSLGYEKKDIEDILDYLIKEGKVKKYGRNYEVIKKAEWRTDFMSTSVPLKVKVPWFDDYANFEDGAMIILGAKTGTGKGHLAMNFIKEFRKDNIISDYFNTESTSGFGCISASIGLKEGDYRFNDPRKSADPTCLELEDRAVTIIDWLKPKNSEYAKTDSIFEALNNQLRKHKGLLIVFVQLRESGEFFAPDMVKQYGSLVAKYLYTPIKNNEKKVVDWDNENTYWQVSKVRKSKIGTQFFTIPMKFNRDTNLLTMRKSK